MGARGRYVGLEAQRSPTVLRILDMIGRFDLPDGPATARAAERTAPRIARLEQRIGARAMPQACWRD